MKYTTTEMKTVTVEKRPSDVYPQGREAVKKALEGFKILDFRLPVYNQDRYLPADYIRVEGPFASTQNPSDVGENPRFIVAPVPPAPDFPEWE